MPLTNPTISTSTDRISSSGWTYDSAGNTLTDANGQSYVYDGENKQVKASNGGGTLGEYFYDGDGKRVKKVVPSTGETTIFVYDAAGKLIGEYSTVVAAAEDARVAYLTADHLGSPRINTDRDGKVTARHDYHPYGEEIITAQRTSHDEYTLDAVRKQFAGYERDSEAGLNFAQARYQDRERGRFTSPDPLMASALLASPQTFNRYSYVLGNPVNLIDPSGLRAFKAVLDGGCAPKGCTRKSIDQDWPLPADLAGATGRKRQPLPGSETVIDWKGKADTLLSGFTEVDITLSMMSDLFEITSQVYNRGLLEAQLYSDAVSEINSNNAAISSAEAESSAWPETHFSVTKSGVGAPILIDGSSNPGSRSHTRTANVIWSPILGIPVPTDVMRPQSVRLKFDRVVAYNEYLAETERIIGAARERFVARYSRRYTSVYNNGKKYWVKFGSAAGTIFDQHVNRARKRGQL